MVSVWGHHFRHNTHKAAYYTSHCMLFICIYAISHVFFLFFTVVLMGWEKFGILYSFWYSIINCFVLF